MCRKCDQRREKSARTADIRLPKVDYYICYIEGYQIFFTYTPKVWYPLRVSSDLIKRIPSKLKAP